MTTTLAVPSSPCDGDDPREANAVFNQVMACTAALTDALSTIAIQHADAAPASSEQVRNLLAIMSTEILDWIWRWPS
jgi:hypothetical protein